MNVQDMIDLGGHLQDIEDRAQPVAWPPSKECTYQMAARESATTIRDLSWAVARLVSALENYGRHHQHCASLANPLTPCDCGLAGHIALRTRPAPREGVTEAMVRAFRRARTCGESVELANDDEKFFAHIAMCKECIRLQLIATLAVSP